MPTFHLCLAQSIRVYGATTIEAATMAEAIEKLRAQAGPEPGSLEAGNAWDCVTEPEWRTANEETIVSIEADSEDDPNEPGLVITGIDLTRDDPERGNVRLTAEELRETLRALNAPGAET